MGNQNIPVTRFIAIFTLSRWSETEPTIYLSSAYMCLHMHVSRDRGRYSTLKMLTVVN